MLTGNLGEKAEKRSALDRDIDTRFDPNRFSPPSRESNRRLGIETSLFLRRKKGERERERKNRWEKRSWKKEGRGVSLVRKLERQTCRYENFNRLC